MKTFSQPGNSVDIVAGGTIVSGAGQLVGASLFGVAVGAAVSGEKYALQIEGVIELPKLSTDNMAVGAKVNWNNSTKELQLATSTLDGVGTVVEAAGASTTKVKVKLTPV